MDRARSLVCAVDSDATNVYITLIARSLRPDLTIVARASEPGSPERLERAGANRVVSPFVTSGQHMATMAMRPEVVDVVRTESDPAHPTIAVEEQLVETGSALAGATVASAGTSVLAIRRSDGEVVAAPVPETVVEPGDTVLLLAAGDPTAGSIRPLGPAAEDPGLLGLELLLGEDALGPELGEALQLGGDVRRGPAGSGRRGGAGGRGGHLTHVPLDLAVLLGLARVVDRLLDLFGVPDERELVAPGLARRLDHSVPAPTIRSKIPCSNRTSLILSSGISIERFAMKPSRWITRLVVTTNIDVTHHTSRRSG